MLYTSRAAVTRRKSVWDWDMVYDVNELTKVPEIFVLHIKKNICITYANLYFRLYNKYLYSCKLSASFNPLMKI